MKMKNEVDLKDWWKMLAKRKVEKSFYIDRIIQLENISILLNEAQLFPELSPFGKPKYI